MLTGTSGKLNFKDTAAIELRAAPSEWPVVLRLYPAAGPANCSWTAAITSLATELYLFFLKGVLLQKTAE